MHPVDDIVLCRFRKWAIKQALALHGPAHDPEQLIRSAQVIEDWVLRETPIPEARTAWPDRNYLTDYQVKEPAQ